ncbi:cellulase family glycosylhydrolase [Gramella sp. AN32]|uniref:Cellulase family glycosylhydrolase n=1 Tax=Christiangramia antarctica TaxID=2058158 RepID=A0ABW5X8W7_9FLAO|nr:cellulase family glycosylhydrolase [Gramella sp. AN32]MCM4157316.1 glycosyl hydrolase family 5 [Gramella sp. AN32]
MKKFSGILILLFLFFNFSGFSQENNTGFLHTKDKKIVDANGENIVLRGIGLGGYMLQEGYMLKVPFSGQQYVFKDSIQKLIGEEKTEEFYKTWRQNFIQKKDIDSMKKWGFNSVRLPMHFNLYTLPVDAEPEKNKNTWLEEGFRLTDSLVSWCKANEMYLILDMHAAPGGQGQDVNISDRDPSKPSLWDIDENQQKLVALWKELALRYKDEKTIGAYDLINEPNWSFEGRENGVEKNGIADTLNEPLRKLMVKITKAIREIDQNHMIVIEGNGWGNNYNGIFPLWDDNMVISFHKYWNYNNTESIQQFLDFRDGQNAPVWMGESGENSNAWFADAIGLMEKNNVGWCWWPLKKLGSNNPIEIKIDEGYQNLLDYWKGEAEKPSKEEAYAAIMQLAENTKIENSLIHYDVIDAMIRQPRSSKTKPFKPISNNSIEAENYDLGNDGNAYKDKTSANYWVANGGKSETGNSGGAYRNDGVDIFENSEAIYVSDTENGEFLHYTYFLPEGGTYRVELKISSEEDISVKIENNAKTFEILPIKNTNGEWKWIPSDTVNLKEGTNTLKFEMLSGDFKFDKIRFIKL